MGSVFDAGVGVGARGGGGKVTGVIAITVIATSRTGVGVGVSAGSGVVLGMTYETPCLDVGTHCSCDPSSKTIRHCCGFVRDRGFPRSSFTIPSGNIYLAFTSIDKRAPAYTAYNGK